MRSLDLILDLVPVVGLEVGDYHAEALVVVDRSGKFFEVKLEGWGPECVPGKGKRAARAESVKLARQWSRAWQRAGSIDVDSADVWALTWAVNGPFKSAGKNVEVIDLRRV